MSTSPLRPYRVTVWQSRSYVVKISACSEEDAIREAEELFDFDNSGFRLRDLDIEGWEAELIDTDTGGSP